MIPEEEKATKVRRLFININVSLKFVLSLGSYEKSFVEHFKNGRFWNNKPIS